MSKHAHTPGPWDYYDMAAYGIAICKGCIGGQNVGHAHMYVGLTAEETTANARLMAAAPDMLEALREARAAAAELCTEQHYKNRVLAVMARIDAAIAKAEGGA
jgi:hypothetical protein